MFPLRFAQNPRADNICPYDLDFYSTIQPRIYLLEPERLIFLSFFSIVLLHALLFKQTFYRIELKYSINLGGDVLFF